MVMAEENKRGEYLKRYKKEVLSRIAVDVKKEYREEIQRHADRCGESLTGYIKRAVQMRMEQESGEIVPAKVSSAVEMQVVERPEPARRDFDIPFGFYGRDEQKKQKGKIIKDPKGGGYMISYAPDEDVESIF